MSSLISRQIKIYFEEQNIFKENTKRKLKEKVIN
jgi:hypothetical protein